MHIKSKGNKKKSDQDDDRLENGPGMTIVRCPHVKTCRFGERQAKQARNRCRGVLCRVNHWEACLIIAFKCQRLRQQIMVEVKGHAIRHITRNSTEHQEAQRRIKQLFCKVCKHRVLDYYVVYGDANIDVKCHRDGHLGSHFIK
jgi:hypothetical protein